MFTLGGWTMRSFGAETGLEGKVAVVTGAASGIGQELCVAYARAGVDTVGGYFAGDPHDPAVTVDLVEREGGRCVVVDTDVCSADAVDALCAAATERFGRLDIAVANAALNRTVPFDEMTDDRWQQTIDVNLSGVMRLFRSAAAAMTGPGALVAVSSVVGPHYAWMDHAHYAAAKSGVLGMVKSLSAELAPRRIRVNAVMPGIIETPQSLDPANGIGATGLAKVSESIPWGRVGEAADVARAIRFLCGDDAGYVTGAALLVDGGLTARMPLG